MNNPLTIEQKKRLEAKIVKAKNPKASYDDNTGLWYVHDGDGGYVIPWMGLQDVLIAADDTGRISDDGQTLNAKGNKLLNLYDNFKDYHHQSPEFYSFLHSLLCT